MAKKKKNKSSSIKDIDKVIDNEIVNNVNLDDEFAESFISYSIMTILDRAIPQIDGMKPSQRRVLYDMYTLKLFPEGSYKKCARVTGDTIGRFHPHGDTGVYSALTHMVNDFDIRYPLIDGQGNFGSPDGDGPAAQRYTEAKLTKLGMEMLKDIAKHGVDMVSNFSEDELEPVILPSLVPSVLINGATGIATGYTTEIPSHNMNEVCDAIIAYLKNNDISLKEVIKYIKGPDLPTKGYLINNEDIEKLYSTGRASLNFKAKIDIEQDLENNINNLVITELPPDTLKPKLVKKIYDYFDIENSKSKDRKVLDVIDGSEGEDVRIILELNKTANPQEVIEELYEKVGLTKSKTYIMRIVDDNQPKLLSLLEIIRLFVEHRRSVILKRSKYKLDEINKRINFLQGLTIVLPKIKEVANAIINCSTTEEAKQMLINKYGLNETQAKYILDKKLSTLVKQEVSKIIDELNELLLEQKDLEEIVNDQNRLDSEIIKEMEYLKVNYGDDRKTKIINEEDFKKKTSKNIENVVKKDLETEMYICLTSKSQIICLDENEYEKFNKKKTYKINRDVITKVLKCKKKDNFIVILKNGNYIKMDFNSLITNAVLEKDDEIINIIIDDNSEKVVLTVTSDGFAKKTEIKNFKCKNLKLAKTLNLETDIEVIYSDIIEDTDDYSINTITNTGCVGRCLVTSLSANGEKSLPKKITGMNEDEKLIFVNVTNKDVDGKILLYASKNGLYSDKVIDLKEFLVKGRTAKPTRTYYSSGVEYIKGLIITKDDILLDENQKISNEYDNFEVVSKSKAMKFKDQELRTFKIV